MLKIDLSNNILLAFQKAKAYINPKKGVIGGALQWQN